MRGRARFEGHEAQRVDRPIEPRPPTIRLSCVAYTMEVRCSAGTRNLRKRGYLARRVRGE